MTMNQKIPKKVSTYSAQRPEATCCVEIVFYSLNQGVIWNSRHVKCCLFAQRGGPEYAGWYSPYSPATKCAFLTSGCRFLDALSTGNCAPVSGVHCPLAPLNGPIHAKLVVPGSLVQAEACCARGRCLPGMLRYRHHTAIESV